MSKKILTDVQARAAKNRKRSWDHFIDDISHKRDWVKCICSVETTTTEYYNHIREVRGLPPSSRPLAVQAPFGITNLVLSIPND